MPTCLLGLGSNLGDSAATLAAAIAEIKALPDVTFVRHSTWHRTQPIGGPAGQGEFFNGAAVVETTVPPLTLLHDLQQIETRHGRKRSERWAPRTLDIDILVYGNEVSETAMLTLPHPRLTFRRFVLEPAAEVSPKLRHPVIGWSIERLLLHLRSAAEQLAIVSPHDSLRTQLATTIGRAAGGAIGCAADDLKRRIIIGRLYGRRGWSSPRRRHQELQVSKRLGNSLMPPRRFPS